MKLRILSTVIVLALLMAGCTASRQADTPSAPPAAEATASVQPVLTTVTAGNPDTPSDHQNDEGKDPCASCGAYDCDGGVYCGSWDHESATAPAQESGDDRTFCHSCGRSDCSGGASCTGQGTHHPEDNHHSRHH